MSSDIAQDIDRIIIHQLKLHQTTTKDLVSHVADKLALKYPDAEFTIPGITARLELLQEQLQIESSEIYNRTVWKLYGENPTIPNRIWCIITSLAKQECHIQSIIYTIRKQHKSITVHDIKDAIGILESNKIIQIKHNVASVTVSERRFLTQEITH